MKLKLIFEGIGLPRLGDYVEVEVFRTGQLHPYGIFMNFGSEKASIHAATSQVREAHHGILRINKVAILVDSRAAHDVNPDRFAEDLVAGGSLPVQTINYIKHIKNEYGVKEAFEVIRQALEGRGYDGIAYINRNEDPGSISFIIWDPSKFRQINIINRS